MPANDGPCEQVFRALNVGDSSSNTKFSMRFEEDDVEIAMSLCQG